MIQGEWRRTIVRRFSFIRWGPIMIMRIVSYAAESVEDARDWALSPEPIRDDVYELLDV